MNFLFHMQATAMKDFAVLGALGAAADGITKVADNIQNKKIDKESDFTESVLVENNTHTKGFINTYYEYNYLVKDKNGKKIYEAKGKEKIFRQKLNIYKDGNGFFASIEEIKPIEKNTRLFKVLYDCKSMNLVARKAGINTIFTLEPYDWTLKKKASFYCIYDPSEKEIAKFSISMLTNETRLMYNEQLNPICILLLFGFYTYQNIGMHSNTGG